MHLGQFHYLPLTPGFFSILIALFVGLYCDFLIHNYIADPKSAG